MALVINIDKAKLISHDLRRNARNAEMAPLDAIIARQIPGSSSDEAEAERQALREKYSDVQIEIEAATDIPALTAIVGAL